ncbi:hypothetical protein HanRHA438_Chr15g0733951 [Helianthus annuus]|nr:hypothetical protein HanRHA438_Chr15g0733951 [Helianthus annuus]
MIKIHIYYYLETEITRNIPTTIIEKQTVFIKNCFYFIHIRNYLKTFFKMILA